MLARVAENVYWMGRYLERIDDTARLINATTHILIDSHRDTGFSWPVLVDVLGEDSERFIKEEHSASERAVMHCLIAAENSTASIRYSCSQLRFNARCVREVIPRDIWEELNGLNLFMQEQCLHASNRHKRYTLMVEVIRRCQMVIGVMDGTMLRDDAYHLFNIGRLLERADMTSRIMDILILHQLLPASGPRGQRGIQWHAVLNALGGVESYQRYVTREDERSDVIDFLMSCRVFPRSISYCLDRVREEAAFLPHNDSLLATLEALRRQMDDQDLAVLDVEGLHALIDTLQSGLNDIHTVLMSDALRLSVA
ncbi:alpha-E domain-containing protein [Larsenimonas rhizosphaerae]|uniref:Alpha-E domain-containing protein n=1 Tax=Larsenimonas rhizosphaerae TaxID=2944682 RepID=A0AA41ZMM2_9GAMM|nr:alpha-E domain-containing protein [Larsenimonas rhizosphaerae]MCM2131663.1 alpha-E domain-containing protein [Larsenimonas rhizosphaerae]MCX2525011.1 alpha-E domain-containing protein [Larsenimonas rhizosphaerae]